MRILIVEDDKILAKTVEQCLGSKFTVDHAYDRRRRNFICRTRNL